MPPHAVGYGVAFSTPIPHVPSPQGGTRLAMISTEWHRARTALMLPTNFNSVNIYTDGMEVGDARCRAVDLVMAQENKCEFIFFIDYDVIVPHDALVKLWRRAREYPDFDIFAGVYCVKSESGDTLIYKGNGRGPHWDWAVGDLLTDGITGVHMGLTLIRTSLFERMQYSADNPLFKTIHEEVKVENGHSATMRGTEDLYFCDRAITEAGAKIFVDTSVLAGHIDHKTGRIYGLPVDSKPVKGARWVDPKDVEYQNQKKALDLGAGGRKRTWEGHTTYTTDIREGVGDFAMDTRDLNFPDAHFDLVASSHHLEHIGRWDQEKVWKEMARILKPGGRMEHTIPTVEWAAQKIANDHVMDEHVMNVLYGAQEAHGYERQFNTHFFGYTRQIARELAEQVAGLVDVEVKDWRDHPDMQYEMVITGTKPAEIVIDDEDEDDGFGVETATEEEFSHERNGQQAAA